MAKATKTQSSDAGALGAELINEAGVQSQPGANPGQESGTTGAELLPTGTGGEGDGKVLAGEEVLPAIQEGPKEIPLPSKLEHQPPLGPDVKEARPNGDLQDISNDTGATEAGIIPMYQGDPKEASAAVLHEARSKRYGPDYVVVTNSQKHTQVFSRQAWDMLKGSKGGWKEAVLVPEEIQALRKAKR